MTAEAKDGTDGAVAAAAEARPVAGRLLREPLVHFVGLALTLFVGAEIVDSWRAPVIEVDPLEVAARVQQLERSRGAALSEEERAVVQLAYIDEMILAREALALGLDDDARIRSILAQKLLHLMSMDLTQPTDDELRAYYGDNLTRYEAPASVTVDQVLAPDDAATGPPPAGVASTELARHPDYEHQVLPQIPLNALSVAFGPVMGERVFTADEGVWVGPHVTEGGQLWLRVTERFERRPPSPYEEVIGQVRFDWITEREEAYLQQRTNELRGRYRVRMLDERDAER